MAPLRDDLPDLEQDGTIPDESALAEYRRASGKQFQNEERDG